MSERASRGHGSKASTGSFAAKMSVLGTSRCLTPGLDWKGLVLELVGEAAANGEARGRRRRGGVHHVEDVVVAVEEEVVDEGAVAGEYLGADAARAERDVVRVELRDVAAHVGDRGGLDGVAPDLGEARAVVAAREPPDAGERHEVAGIPRVETQAAVALARQRRDRVRPRPHL